MRPERAAAPARRVGVRRRPVFGAALAALLAMCTTVGVRAEEYRLQPGDVIELTVVGVPDMNMRASIQIDGSLSFPLVGPLEAAGLTIGETRSRIQTSLSSRLLPAYLPDGREVLRAVDRDQISASIADYRPVFVGGDVAQPGEIRFRPGMTVRQAIAAAGGGRIVQVQSTSINESALRADYAGAWQSAAAASARVWRLRQELGEVVAFDTETWSGAPGAPGALEEVLRVEKEVLGARQTIHRQERTHLVRTLTQIDSQIDVLQRLLEVAKANEAIDAEALAVGLDANARGLLNQARIADIRVAALISSTRRLQTESSLMQLERRRTEADRELVRLEEDRELDLLSALQDARVAEARELARLRSADEQLRAAGLAPPTSQQGEGAILIPTLIRAGAEVKGPVTHDTRIQPGDVLEVHRGMRLPVPATGAVPTDGRRAQAAVHFK